MKTRLHELLRSPDFVRWLALKYHVEIGHGIALPEAGTFEIGSAVVANDYTTLHLSSNVSIHEASNLLGEVRLVSVMGVSYLTFLSSALVYVGKLPDNYTPLYVLTRGDHLQFDRYRAGFYTQEFFLVAVTRRDNHVRLSVMTDLAHIDLHALKEVLDRQVPADLFCFYDTDTMHYGYLAAQVAMHTNAVRAAKNRLDRDAEDVAPFNEGIYRSIHAGIAAFCNWVIEE